MCDSYAWVSGYFNSWVLVVGFSGSLAWCSGSGDMEKTLARKDRVRILSCHNMEQVICTRRVKGEELKMSVLWSDNSHPYAWVFIYTAGN